MEAEYSTFLTVNGAFVFNVDALADIVRVDSSYTEGDILLPWRWQTTNTISGTNLHQLMSDHLCEEPRDRVPSPSMGCSPRTVRIIRVRFE